MKNRKFHPWRYNLESDTLEPVEPPTAPPEEPEEPEKPFEEMTDKEKIDDMARQLSEANKVIATLTGGDTNINITMNRPGGSGTSSNPLKAVFERIAQKRNANR